MNIKPFWCSTKVCHKATFNDIHSKQTIFKVNNKVPRNSAKICPKLTKTSKWHDRHCCGIPVVKQTFVCRVNFSLSWKLTTVNQMFLTNNNRAISRFLGTVALTNWPRFSLFKVNYRNTKNTRAGCEISLKLTLRTPERRRQHCSGVFIVNF